MGSLHILQPYRQIGIKHTFSIHSFVTMSPLYDVWNLTKHGSLSSWWQLINGNANCKGYRTLMTVNYHHCYYYFSDYLLWSYQWWRFLYNQLVPCYGWWQHSQQWSWTQSKCLHYAPYRMLEGLQTHQQCGMLQHCWISL